MFSTVRKNRIVKTVTNCHQLKMPASDNKMNFIDIANTEKLLYIKKMQGISVAEYKRKIFAPEESEHNASI